MQREERGIKTLPRAPYSSCDSCWSSQSSRTLSSGRPRLIGAKVRLVRSVRRPSDFTANGYGGIPRHGNGSRVAPCRERVGVLAIADTAQHVAARPPRRKRWQPCRLEFDSKLVARPDQAKLVVVV